jgi:hypothetical protein
MVRREDNTLPCRIFMKSFLNELIHEAGSSGLNMQKGQCAT